MGLIRLILAIGVVFSHSGSVWGYTTIGGSIAVQAFYIISGFYIALILNEKYVGNNGSYKLFISNRFLRLYPIYWIVLLLTFLSAFAFSQLDMYQYVNSYSMFQKYSDAMDIGTLLFMIFTNVFLFFQDVVMFLGFDKADGSLFFTADFHQTNPKLYYFLFVAQAWSIGIEVMFYLIAPFLAKRSLKIIILILISSFALRMVIYYHFNLQHDPWSYRFFPTELLFFLLGIIAYRIYTILKEKQLNNIFLKSVFIAVVAFSLMYRYITIPGKMTLYLLLFFSALPFIFILSKNWKTDRQLGELSYPIYISHIFILSWVGALQIKSGSWRTVIVILLSVLFAYLLNIFVGNKIEKFRQSRVK